MGGLIHSFNKILEACAEILEKEMSINRFQFLRYFEIFPYDFPYARNDQLEEPENWYYLRDKRRHNALFFNYKKRELKLINEEYDWKEKYIEELQKSEEQIMKEKELYKKEIETILDSFVYKNLKSMINWYFSCPDISLGGILPTPKEFLLMLLKKNLHWLKIKDDENLEDLRDSLLEAFHYEERNKK